MFTKNITISNVNIVITISKSGKDPSGRDIFSKQCNQQAEKSEKIRPEKNEPKKQIFSGRMYGSFQLYSREMEMYDRSI